MDYGLAWKMKKASEKGYSKAQIESNPRLVYLGDTYYSDYRSNWSANSISITAARSAVEKYGGEPLMLWIRLRDGDEKYLTIDEDSAYTVCPRTSKTIEARETPKFYDLPKPLQDKILQLWRGTLRS